MALYIKNIYKKDPHFKETKVVYNLYNERFNDNWDSRFFEKLKFDGFPKAMVEKAKDTDFLSITKLIVEHCDGLTIAEPNLSQDLMDIFDQAACHKMEYMDEEKQAKSFSAFFDKVIDESVLA